MRPRSLLEVVAVSKGGPREDFDMALREFCDAFYIDYPDKMLMQAHLEPVPEIIGDAEKDAWIGAVGEHLALRWGLKIPAWTQRPEHFALNDPVFMPPSPALQNMLIAESPPAFRARLIFTMIEPLQRAFFPAGVEKIRAPWDKRANVET